MLSIIMGTISAMMIFAEIAAIVTILILPIILISIWLNKKKRNDIETQQRSYRFCRNCGKVFSGNPYVCMNCGAKVMSGKRYCPKCGNRTDENAVVCVHCGLSLISASVNEVSIKSKLVAGLLGILMGALGIHNFYLGYTFKGTFQVLLSIFFWFSLSPGLYVVWVWGLIEGIMILCGIISKDASGRTLV